MVAWYSFHTRAVRDDVEVVVEVLLVIFLFSLDSCCTCFVFIRPIRGSGALNRGAPARAFLVPK